MSTVFVLGPSLESVVEPDPAALPPPVAPGRRGVEFRDPGTTPGGIVNLRLLPALAAGDAKPVNVYAFYVFPPSRVPAVPDRTPDWFFKAGVPSGSNDLATEPSDEFQVQVPGVAPGVYHVQTVLEYAA